MTPARPAPSRLPAPVLAAESNSALRAGALWLQALDAAGLASLLTSPGALTLLVPSDTAVAAWLVESGQTWPSLLADTPALRELLLSHLLPQRCDADALPVGPIDTLGPAHLTVERRSGRLLLRSANGASAALLSHGTAAAIRPSTIAIDHVLAPPAQTLWQWCSQQPELTEFSRALQRTGLDEVLGTHGPFTVFAASNAGFDHLPARLGLSRAALWRDTARLGAVLRSHIVAGRWTSHRLPWGDSLLTAQGTRLPLTRLGLVGSGAAAQALCDGSDHAARNGLVHRISEPLLPAA